MTTPTIPFYPVTHDDGTNIVSALNSIASARRTPLLIADAFSNLTNYDVNDYVIYENNLYRFTASHPAGSWNYSQVVRVSLGEELERKVDNSAVAPEFRNDANYAVGDVVSYKGGLYRYLSPHIEGDWDRSEVVATNAISEGGGGGGGTGVGDEITFDGDNMIITSSGRSIESLESSIAIVANGNTHPLIYPGEYVYVKMHDTLPEGLYTANSTIVETDDLTTSNLSSVSKGGMNDLKSKVGSNYCKMPDGILIQWGTTQVTTSSSGGLFGYMGNTRITFEIPFLTNTTPIVISDPNENGGFWNTGSYSITATSFNLYMGGNMNATKTPKWIAIGRWK